jgi:APA family basic amino acid/polyamine antiporter
MLGQAGPRFLASIVVLSVIASVLALLIMAPRLYLAMSRDRIFPSALAARTQMTQSPIRATALLAVLASVFVFVASFQEIVAYFMCTTLVFIALAAGALVVVRRRGPAAVAFHAPGYPITPILFVLLVLGVVVRQESRAMNGLRLLALVDAMLLTDRRSATHG